MSACVFVFSEQGVLCISRVWHILARNGLHQNLSLKGICIHGRAFKAGVVKVFKYQELSMYVHVPKRFESFDFLCMCLQLSEAESVSALHQGLIMYLMCQHLARVGHVLHAAAHVEQKSDFGAYQELTVFLHASAHTSRSDCVSSCAWRQVNHHKEIKPVTRCVRI
jgi:hypothetical protein